MEYTQLLEELAEAVAVRNGQVASLRNTSAQVTELIAQAIAAGAPGPSLTNVLATLDPLISQDRPHEPRQDSVVQLPRPQCAAPSPAAPAGADGSPQIVRRLLDAFATHSDPAWLTLAQIADHLVGADSVTWGRWEGRHNRLIMIGRTIQSALRRAGLQIPVDRLSAAIDPKRPAIYQLADIQSAGQSFERRHR
ncbi:hypothetical protein AB0E27_38755 [Streptomyces sparsogenes]|uniref:hypothetical protein n=1 Tax=Streptomyces sparsogenes TaxID=67365 RepID=UPI0033DC9546